MTDIILIGAQGRMSLALQEQLKSRGQSFKIHSRQQPLQSFRGCGGVVDFSSPEAFEEIAQKTLEAQIPWVCGSTGFKNMKAVDARLKEIGNQIPFLWDSNFSLGVERLCQWAERMAGDHPKAPVEILDIHHIHKKDSPSGTALKIQSRILQASPQQTIEIVSKREGEVFGIHSVTFKLKDENLTLTHEARSRNIFAEGALSAMEWLQKKSKGFYTMRDVLK